MKNTEKQLIINLFKKIKDISLQTPNKDSEAIKLINFLLQNQNDAIYYMVQTLLVQDIVIQELNGKIQTLENQDKKKSIKSTSFLSDCIKQKVCDVPMNYNTSDENSNSLHTKKVIPYATQYNNSNYKDNVSNNTGGISSFLGNAVQTAVGVAGGMVAGNMLANFFNGHDKENHLNHSINSDSTNTSHSDALVNNFLQVDDDSFHEDNFNSEDTGDMYDLDEDF